MLTYQDCLELCELTEEEVEAIAEHEHIPQILAAEMGHYLVNSHEGVVGINKMIREDIESSRRRGNFAHAAKLKLVLRHFVETHAEDFKDETNGSAWKTAAKKAEA